MTGFWTGEGAVASHSPFVSGSSLLAVEYWEFVSISWLNSLANASLLVQSEFGHQGTTQVFRVEVKLFVEKLSAEFWALRRSLAISLAVVIYLGPITVSRYGVYHALEELQ